MSQWEQEPYGGSGHHHSGGYQPQSETYVAYVPPQANRQYDSAPQQHAVEPHYSSGPPSSQQHAQSYYPSAHADEIRTLFITGFPFDFTERELNCLLRFLPGYEVGVGSGRSASCCARILQHAARRAFDARFWEGWSA